MFYYERIPVSKIRIIPKTNKSLQQFITGKIDAFNGSMANQADTLRQIGIDYKMIKPITYGIDFYGDTLFTSESLFNKDPQKVNKFLKASIKGWKYALKNQAEIIDLIKNKYNSKLSVKHLTFEAKILNQLIAFPLVEIGNNNFKRWERIHQTFIDLKIITDPLDLRKIIFDPNPKIDLAFLRIIIISFSFTVLVIIIIFLFIILRTNTNTKRIISIKNLELQTMNEDLNVTNEEFEALNEELIEAQHEILSSLKEKEILLKEIHHRVKNNLQVISSLLSLQSNYVQNQEDKKLFDISIARINSMALIHEKLYQTKNFSQINFNIYISELIDELKKTYDNSFNSVEYSLISNDIMLTIEKAIPFGLIITELVTNALKYGLKNDNSGIISLELKESNNEISFSFSDNGKGLPLDFHTLKDSSLGLTLIESLVNQLKGSLSVTSNEGTNYIIQFPKT